MTLHLSRPRAKRRWALLGAIVMALSLAGVAVVQAQLDKTLFELDKDASANNTFTNGAGLPGKIGVLNAAVAASAGPTAIQICQDVSAPYDGAKILVDAERMTLADGANAAGGGCPSDFSFKRNYNATRGVDLTTPGAHSKAEDVSRFAAATPASHDWNEVYASISADGNDEGDDDKCIALGAVECVFVHDGRAMSIFTQSKDYDEISDDDGATVFWKWRDQSVPDADELDDGFAIKYVDGNDEQHVYFGADRFATNGTKDAGFWFFHDEVGTELAASGDSTFSGVHTAPVDGAADGFCNPGAGGTGGPSTTPNCAVYDDNDTGGDVLILTSFSGGGAVVTARVFEWIGPAGSTAALLERSTSADCVPGNINQSVCATVNNTTVESGTFGGPGLWPYSGKSEPALNQIASGGFLEGGVNLTDLGLEGCFSSFMATSRSSDSLTADPKDFILGSFEACDTEVTTTPSDGENVALEDSNDNDIPDIQIGTGDAGVDVSDALLLDVKGTNVFTGTLNFFLCGPIETTETCDEDGVEIGAATGTNPVTSNGTYHSATANLTEVGYYCWRGEFTSGTDGVPDDTDASDGECFEVLPVTPDLSTTAWSTGDDTGEAQTDPVDFGDPLFDRADLSGTAHQPGDDGPGDANGDYTSINATMDTPANGTITFTLVGPDGETTDCTTVATSDDATEDNPEDVTVSGDGDYYTSGFTPNAPGDYHWKASYSGDDPNTLSTTHNDDCDEVGEDVTVRQIPTEISTAQSVYPNDSATIESSESGVNLPGGTVIFRLYSSLTSCEAHGTTVGSGGLLYEETETLTGGAASETVSTSNTSVAVDADADVYWWVTYDPEDDAFTGRQSDCLEHTDIDFTNDAGPGTLFP